MTSLSPALSYILRKFGNVLRPYGIATVIFLVGLFSSHAVFDFAQRGDTDRMHQECERRTETGLLLIQKKLLETLGQIKCIKQTRHSYQVSEKSFHHFLQTSFHFSNLLSLSIGWIKTHAVFEGMNDISSGFKTPLFIAEQNNKNPTHWEISFIVIFLAGLIASYLHSLINRRLLIEKEVQARTKELSAMNCILQNQVQEGKKIEEKLALTQEYLYHRLMAINDLTKFTFSDPKQAIHEVIMRTASVMKIDRVSVWFFEKKENDQVLFCVATYGLDSRSCSNEFEFSSEAFPHYFRALSDHPHLCIPSIRDLGLNSELSSYLGVFNIKSKLDIPIIFEGKLLGVLCCEETRRHLEWLLEDRHFGQTIANIIAIMMTQFARHKAEKALQESEERLRFITKKAVDGIISVDDHQTIISWNTGAQRIFGYPEEQIIGKSLFTVIPQRAVFLQRTMNTKTMELKGQHLEGHLFPIEISHTHWKSGELFFDTLIIRDITKRKKHEKQLIQAMKEAKAANEAKNEFLATISHELRTPLNAIIGFNQCLLIGMDGPINEQQRVSLIKIEKSSFHLLNLISDILDFAKIEAHRVELELASYNIVEIAESCLDEMLIFAQHKNLNVTFVPSKPIILIEIDKIRIRQVLLNLLSNAIKFTEAGSIELIIIDYLNHIEIRIKDSGIGLSKEEIKKIFFPFSQADSSITRKYGGTGLGLIICKNIVELHHGKIKVKSQKGYGSIFTVRLPKNF